MKKANTNIDKSSPYRNLGIGKVTAPVKPDADPKGTSIKSSSDLRARKENK